MSTPPSTKPREWTLHGSTVAGLVNGLFNLIGSRLSDEVVHVIEKSAYDQAVAERDDLASVLAGVEEQAKKNSEYDEWRVARLTVERDEARAEVEQLRADLRMKLDFAKECERLTAEVARLSEIVSNLAKVPTEPYERELAKTVL